MSNKEAVKRKLKAEKELVLSFLNKIYLGEETFSYLLGRGGLLCQVEVAYPDNRRQVFGTVETVHFPLIC